MVGGGRQVHLEEPDRREHAAHHPEARHVFGERWIALERGGDVGLHADGADFVLMRCALFEQQRHGVALGQREIIVPRAEHRVLVAGFRAAVGVFVSTLTGRDLDVRSAGEREDLLRDERPAHGVARDGGDGFEVERRVPDGEGDRQRVVNVGARVGIEDEGRAGHGPRLQAHRGVE